MHSRGKTAFVIGFLAVVATATAAAAGEGHWTSSGPFGGEVRRIVADPSDSDTLYLATPQGVFRGNGLGRVWTEASGNLADRRLRDLAVDAAGALFVATPSGVFRSDDGGGTWQPRRAGLPDEEVDRLAADPATPGIVYAGVGGEAPVYKSVDGGASWSPASDGLGFFPRFAREMDFLAVHPARPDSVWVAFFGSLYHSRDGGAHWEQAVADSRVLTSVTAIAFSATDPDRVYAGGGFGTLFTSADGGATWSQLNVGFELVQSLLAVPGRPDVVLVGTVDGRLLRAFAEGRDTELLNGHGFRSAPIHALAELPSAAGGLAAGTAAGVFRSLDGGRRWRASSTGLRALEIRRVVVDPADSEIVYAASWGGGVFRSTDRGQTWKPAFRRVDGPFAADLAIDPERGTIFAAAQRLFRSDDGGVTWRRVRVRKFAEPRNERHNRIWIDSTNDRIYVGGGRFTNDIYRSVDQGRSWESLYSFQFFRGKNLHALTGDPSGVVYAAMTRGILRSADAGESWSWRRQFVGQRAVIDLDVDPASPTTLYAVLRSAGFRKSTDEGRTWARTSRDLARNRLRALTLDPARAGTLYAATLASGVLVSRDGGETFSAVGDLSEEVLDVTVDPRDPSRLYAATRRGVFEIDTN